MAGNINKVFYIAKEDFKYADLDEEVQRKQIYTIHRGIEESIGRDLHIEFTIERNGTLRFSLLGPQDSIQKAIALIQRRLRRDGLQKIGDLPEGIQPLTLDNLKLHNRTLEQRRQFTCGPCKESWWRWVPTHKPVSRCHKCTVRYDALARADEHGKGTYRCSCGNVFTGKARHNVAAKCSNCQEMVYPSEIGPLRENQVQRRSRHGHSCEACAHGHIYPCPAFVLINNAPDGILNVQRSSRHGHSYEVSAHGHINPCPAFVNNRGPNVFGHARQVGPGGRNPRQIFRPSVSTPHESTGSTCSTFLTQQTVSEYFEPI